MDKGDLTSTYVIWPKVFYETCCLPLVLFAAIRGAKCTVMRVLHSYMQGYIFKKEGEDLSLRETAR